MTRDDLTKKYLVLEVIDSESWSLGKIEIQMIVLVFGPIKH